jgi:WD40 repeat protein
LVDSNKLLLLRFCIKYLVCTDIYESLTYCLNNVISFKMGDEDNPSTSDWAVKSVVQDVGDQMDALCTNKNFDLLTVAGRSVMKVFSLRNNEFKQEVELRSKTRRMNLYFSGSISWNPVEPLVAATSSTGSIVLFDIEKCRGNNAQDSDPITFIDADGPSSVDQLFRANKAAATKVCFHSYDPKLLISGSRDATIYLYDLKYKKPVTSFA